MNLDSIFDFTNGKAWNKNDKGIYPVYGSTGIIDYYSDYLFNGNKTLIARVGQNCGFTQYVDNKYWVTDNTIVATAKEHLIIPKFGYYLLSSLNLQRYKIGAAQPLLTIGILKSINVNIPSIKTQQHIVNTIGTIDDLIENMQKQNDKIDKILTKYFSNLSASDHRLITDICDIKYGKGFVASKLDYNYKYPVYGGNGIIGTSKDYMFNIPKIAISCRGAASGNVILTKAYSSISSNSLYLDLFNNDSLLPLFYYLKKANLTSFTTGSAQPQITIENINKLHIPDSLEYNIKLNNYLKVMDLNSNKINTLKKIKETLLSKYF